MTTITRTTLVIRFANPDTTPSMFAGRGFPSAEYLGDGYWTVTAADDKIRAYVERVLAANDLNDYTIRDDTSEACPKTGRSASACDTPDHANCRDLHA